MCLGTRIVRSDLIETVIITIVCYDNYVLWQPGCIHRQDSYVDPSYLQKLTMIIDCCV